MDSTDTDKTSHLLSETLVAEAIQVRGEQQLFQERLKKLEETKQDFGESVYQKVKKDYIDKLAGADKKFASLRQELEKDLQLIQKNRKTLQGTYQERQEVLEEARLRLSLGEYQKDQFHEIEQRESQEIKKLEKTLKELDGEETRFRELFGAQAPGMTAKGGEPTTSKIKIQATPPEEPTLPKAQAATPEKKVPQLVHMEKDKVIEKIPVDKTIEIGRSPSNHIVLNEPKVSRRHAEVQFVGGKYILVDLESSNGTYVAGKKVKEHPLQPNDEIKIGNATLIFQF